MGELREGAKISRIPTGPCKFNTKLFILSSPEPAYRVNIHSSCYHNELLALRNRHLVEVAHKPDINYVKSVTKHLLPLLKLDNVEPISIYKLANQYVGGKKRMYLRACEKIREYGWVDSWRNVSMFVKPDKYPQDAILEKAPRAIQYRSPMYNLQIGRFLHSYEHALFEFKDIGPSRTTFFAKGKNNHERAQILMEKIGCFENPLFVCLDHSRFDSSIAPELLQLEHLVYWRQFKSRWLRRLLRYQINNKGYTKSGIKYRVRGTRMSGDYNTGLGNSIINYLCLRSFLGKLKGEVFLDGDDSIVIVERADYPKLDMSHFARWGFTTKVGVTDDICQVEFCQSRLLPSGPVMARNPFRALSHLAVSVKRYPPRTWPRLQQARGMCEVRGSAGVPILARYGEAMLTGVKPLFDQDTYAKWRDYSRAPDLLVTDAIRLEYYRAWGIEPFMQELIEESFSDPQTLSVCKLSSNSDQYDDESLRATFERWLALGPSCREHWRTGSEGGMALL